jgi:hypothetical protein
VSEVESVVSMRLRQAGAYDDPRCSKVVRLLLNEAVVDGAEASVDDVGEASLLLP